jgi:hypothetical protein
MGNTLVRRMIIAALVIVGFFALVKVLAWWNVLSERRTSICFMLKRAATDRRSSFWQACKDRRANGRERSTHWRRLTG